jgi:hypothetical protein
MGLLFERGQLRLLLDTTCDGANQDADPAAERAKDVGDLEDQLACRLEDEGEHWPGRLEELMQDWEGERTRLAGARFGHPADVPVRQRQGNGRDLDRGRKLKAHGLRGVNHLLAQGEVVECE